MCAGALRVRRAENADLKNQLRAALASAGARGSRTPALLDPREGRAGRISLDAAGLQAGLGSRWLRASTAEADVEDLLQAEGATSHGARGSLLARNRAGRNIEAAPMAPVEAAAKAAKEGSFSEGATAGATAPRKASSFKEDGESKAAVEGLLRRLQEYEASTAAQAAVDATKGPNGGRFGGLTPSAVATAAAEREAALLSDLRRATELAKAAGSAVASSGENSRARAKLEGMVTRLEVEKSELEAAYEEMEAEVAAAQAECQELSAQVTWSAQPITPLFFSFFRAYTRIPFF